MIRYLTAGESHGPQLTAIIEGMPSGIFIKESDINQDLARRQMGYGRGGRMNIEKDVVKILSGVRWGKTLGSPIALVVSNRDWANWKEKMSPYDEFRDESISVTCARPGHADLTGAIKYAHKDIRNVLERSSARETAVRVAVGAVCKLFLGNFGINVTGFVSEIGTVKANKHLLTLDEVREIAKKSEMFTYDVAAEERMKAEIDSAKESGDTVGGVVEVVVSGVPPGLGSHVHWDRKLDAKIAMAVMSIQAIKGVELGIGFESGRRLGSMVHDEIFYDEQMAKDHNKSGFYRKTNNAGGIEGGMSNGEDITIRAVMKPIPTLYKPLMSVDLQSKHPFEATVERSDTCAVPAAAVVAESVVAIEVANAMLEKFGGDSMEEIHKNVTAYQDYVSKF